MHVFADLKPYICTFPDCAEGLTLFASRATWAEHEFTQHRITHSWGCLECSKSFPSALEWQKHVKEGHFLFQSETRLRVVRDMVMKPEPNRIEEMECPLCRTVLGKPRRAFVQHVGRHMEEIALIVLPKNVDEDSELDIGSTDQGSLSSASIQKPLDDPALPAQELNSSQHLTIKPRSTKHECKICGKIFTRRRDWKRHEMLHNQDREYPYPCTATTNGKPCGKRFMRRVGLDRHYDSMHLSDRKYRCNLCGNRFAHRDSLNR